MADWRRVQLGQICRFKYGEMPKKTDLTEEGYLVYSGYRVVGHASRYHYREPEIIVVARGVGGTGDVKMTPPFCFLTNLSIAILPETPEVFKPFLFYQLSATTLWKLRTGSAQAQITIERLKDFEVDLPPPQVQRRIAGILSAYDELIENNERRVRILEEMARVLYREWFVDFRLPCREKVDLVPSHLGPVPEGWDIKTFGDLVTYNRRATKPGDHLSERRYVPIDCLPSKSLALLEARPIDEAQSSLQLFERGNILFGAMRPYFHKVVIAPFDGVTRTTCFVLKPARPEWSAFATMTAFDESTIAYANAHSQGATIPYAVWDGALSHMPLILPPPGLLQLFERVVGPILARASQSFFVLNNLRRTRDLLLPRLLSAQSAPPVL